MWSLRVPLGLALAATALVFACGGESQSRVRTDAPVALPTVVEQPNVCEEQAGRVVTLESRDLTVYGSPLCFSWRRRFDGEQGFFVIVKFPQTGETFEHRLAAGTTSFALPPAEQPRCEQGGYTVEIRVVRMGSSEPFTGWGKPGGCGP